MESGEICSSIWSIYDRFVIPSNLRLHMCRVASVADIICDNWEGARINKQDIEAACLLHDIGNIAKFDFTRKDTVRLLGEDGKDIDHWKKVKEGVVARYGKSDHEASHNMLVELGVGRRPLSIIEGMGRIFEERGEGQENDYELMIPSYSDCRVKPEGVSSITDRFTEFAERCKDNPSAEMRARGVFVVSHLSRALEMERDIFAKERIKPRDINDKSIKPYLERYIR